MGSTPLLPTNFSCIQCRFKYNASMKKVFHTSLFGQFVLPINTIDYVDTDQKNFKIVIHFIDNEPVEHLYFAYQNLANLIEDVKALGKAIQKFHDCDGEKQKEPKVETQVPEQSKDAIDSLEVQ